LYVSADNIWFSGNRLFDLANDFEKQSGKDKGHEQIVGLKND